jgi:hypothetical protein
MYQCRRRFQFNTEQFAAEAVVNRMNGYTPDTFTPRMIEILDLIIDRFLDIQLERLLIDTGVSKPNAQP